MIELISETKCIHCNLCVKVCPTNVFDIGEGKHSTPKIARKQDCQTCFMCEIYCPVDALYVAPEAEENVDVSEVAIEQSGLLGSYREAIGWGKGRTPVAAKDMSYLMLKGIREQKGTQEKAK